MLSGFFEFWTFFLSANFLGARLIGIQVDNSGSVDADLHSGSTATWLLRSKARTSSLLHELDTYMRQASDRLDLVAISERLIEPRRERN